MTISPRCVFVHWARLGVRGDSGMSLPLLALRPGGETATPFPNTTVTFTLEFNPAATRILNGASFTKATAVLTVINKLDEMSPKMQNVAKFLRDWVCRDIIKRKEKARSCPMGPRVAHRVGGVQRASRGTPAHVQLARRPQHDAVRFDGLPPELARRQRKALLLFTFAVYEDKLGDAWVAQSRSLHTTQRTLPRLELALGLCGTLYKMREPHCRQRTGSL